MALEVGIVGLPNVGKSTLFNALTGTSVATENYPFTTIDPNVGVVAIRDERLERIAEIARPDAVVPASIEFVDIAGLVGGAASGEGLGNRFLGRIREVDAIAHVVRCFEDLDIAHVDGGIDPARDVEIVQTELTLADLDTVERALERYQRKGRAGEADSQRVVAVLERVKDHLSAALPARSLDLTAFERATTTELHLLTSIPVMYIANIAEPAVAETSHIAALRAVAAEDGAVTSVVAVGLEAEIATLDEVDRDEFRTAMGSTESGLERVVGAAYDLLDLGTFFTATGGHEARAWSFPTGTTASAGAGLIHTDFERGFVQAEVVGYPDYVTLGGEHGAREAGKLRIEGRDYWISDGDVIKFRFNL